MRAANLVTRLMGLSMRPSCDSPVQTSNGFIVGHEAPNASHVIEYLGIPYAQPPIGHLRFAAPLPFAGDAKSTFSASQFVSTCDITFSRGMNQLTCRGTVSVCKSCAGLGGRMR